MKRKASDSSSYEDSVASDVESSYEEIDTHSSLPINERFYTALHSAAESNNVELCEQLIKEYPNAVTDLTDLSYTPLDLAAMNGCLESFKILIDNMEIENIYTERSNGHTTMELLLMESKITQSHHEIFQILIDKIPESRTIIKDTHDEIIVDAYRNSPKLLTINFNDLLKLAEHTNNQVACGIILKKSPSTVLKKNDNEDGILATYKNPMNNVELVPNTLENLTEEETIPCIGQDNDLG